MNMNEERYFPKILFINSHSIFANNNTGISIRSMFESWPQDKKMEIYHIAVDSTYSAPDIISKKIPDKTFPLFNVCKKIRSRVSGRYIRSDTKGADAAGRQRPNRQNYIDILNLAPLCFDRKLLKIIKQFSPDMIYSTGAAVDILKVTLFLSRKTKTNVMIHYFDNWRETCYLKKRVNHYLHKLERTNAVGLVISDKMKNHYETAYNHSYVTLMNSISLPELKYAGHRICNSITYVGGLHLGRYKTLLEVQNGIKEISHELNIQFKLYIYTSDACQKEYKPYFDEDITVFKDYVEHDQINDVYDASDILLHVESFEEDKDYIKYSISTKIPEYLASGKPLICYSPDDIAVYEYIAEHDAGICASCICGLKRAVITLRNDQAKKECLVKRAYALSRKNHTKEKAAEVIYDAVKRSL